MKMCLIVTKIKLLCKKILMVLKIFVFYYYYFLYAIYNNFLFWNEIWHDILLTGFCSPNKMNFFTIFCLFVSVFCNFHYSQWWFHIQFKAQKYSMEVCKCKILFARWRYVIFYDFSSFSRIFSQRNSEYIKWNLYW